ncbi:thioredoxin domain-containing protein [Candidatus Protochlamydia phocaeensis]|uniref:thioredoxin domain-containing protein n=1 Tax=Candidatus Protochlamydia phocaeensis TaxID=1414722 RepID=UPI000837F88F|nr:thioredoxin domain-containing protein [Candidatus Protochlamydia phocaeensis]
MTDRPLYTNRLINEKSPYLLQHAHNPVDWYPWGEEAFEAARSQDKPIFLSIGYATCHWCHVMERESFEDIGVAQLMNQVFINIKVDREELPDVDSLYMEFAQSMMAGAAGWPLNVILTPHLQPFFAATYLPPHSSHGLMGLSDLIVRISELWTGEEREKILTQAEKIVEVFSSSVQTGGEDISDEEQIQATADLLYKMADPIYGGIKGAPKFPIGYQSSFMLRYYAGMKDSRALFLVERTLDMMHRGGIYDHLAGGFSRYSVDEKWLIPHFEKMLYDNAILVQSYLEAWQLTKKPLYREVCEEIVQYVLRDMTHPEGGFYSAEDADSEGHEGLFYTWPYEEVKQVLGNDSDLFCQFYEITPEGNFEGRNVLHTPLTLEEFAAQHHKDEEELKRLFGEQRKKLWQVREKRVHPFKDDKILCSWNGLMIYSLAEAAYALNHPPYLEAAIKAARFIKTHLWKEGKLLRRWRDGQAMFTASLDEYAFLIKGVLSLFEANAGTEWLEWAVEMTNILKDGYKAEGGAFYQTDGTDKNLILRKCQFSDGAEPSGNAVHCENLLRLYQLTNQEDFLLQAEDIFKGVKEYLENYSPGYCFHIMNLHRFYDDKAPTLVIALNSKREFEPELKQLIYEHFIPHKAIIWQTQDIALEELIPFIKTQTTRQDQTTLYICYEGVCQQPLTTLEDMRLAIEKLA